MTVICHSLTAAAAGIVVTQNADVANVRHTSVEKRDFVVGFHGIRRDAGHITRDAHPEDVLLIGFQLVAGSRASLDVNPVDPVVAALKAESLREFIPVSRA